MCYLGADQGKVIGGGGGGYCYPVPCHLLQQGALCGDCAIVMHATKLGCDHRQVIQGKGT